MIFDLLKKIYSNFFKKKNLYVKNREDLIEKNDKFVIPRENHIISRKNIGKNALKILYRLKEKGYQSYLVGGAVRDLLLNIKPKDFDIVTDAKPNQIKKIFRNCRLIGRRFKIAHVYFKNETIEVTTFRADCNNLKFDNNIRKSKSEKNARTYESKNFNKINFQNNLLNKSKRKHSDDGIIMQDNVYGSCIFEDSLRRDFTINSLYYNVYDFSLIDCVDGLKDLQNREIRLIGDPNTRYKEDPVRMLRAIRFSAKLNFSINVDTKKAIYKHGFLLEKISPARLFEEYIKLFLSGYGYKNFFLLQEYELLQHLFFQTAKYLKEQNDLVFIKLIHLALQDTDQRILQSKTISKSFLLAVLLWGPMQKKFVELSSGKKDFDSFNKAIAVVLRNVKKNIIIPRYASFTIKDIWFFQMRFKFNKSVKKAKKIFYADGFCAAYKFLLLRAKANDQEAKKSILWWDKYTKNNVKG